MEDDRASALGVGDRVCENAVGHGERRGIRGVVEVERGSRRRGGEVGSRLDRQQLDPGARERDRREVVGVAGVGKQHRLALLDRAERELGERGLDPRDDRHLARRVELDPVGGAVAVRDRLLQRRQAGEGGVAVDGRIPGGRGAGEGLTDVRGRRQVGVATAEVDHVRAGGGSGRSDSSEQRGEVLLRQAAVAVGRGPHARDATAAAASRCPPPRTPSRVHGGGSGGRRSTSADPARPRGTS